VKGLGVGSFDATAGVFAVRCRSTFALATVAGGFWPASCRGFPLQAASTFPTRGTFDFQ